MVNDWNRNALIGTRSSTSANRQKNAKPATVRQNPNRCMRPNIRKVVISAHRTAATAMIDPTTVGASRTSPIRQIAMPTISGRKPQARTARITAGDARPPSILPLQLSSTAET